MSLYKKFAVALLSLMAFCFLTPIKSPAPLIWTKGEGWSWEHGGVTVGTNPVDQLKIAQGLQAKKDYRSAIDAYRRVIHRWPQSISAQDAQFGLAECLGALRYYYQAFKAYQLLVEKHPNTSHFDAVLQRQFEIGNLFLAGERQKAWGIRWFPSSERTIEVFEQVVKNGPYSPVAAEAQYRIGLTYEKQNDYLAAVHAYEKILERYPKSPLAETAQFQIGAAYKKESQRSEYDQNAANQAIAAFTDFLLRYPDSEKAPLAQQDQLALKEEQAKGLFNIGRFYEKSKEYKSALIYYNDVIETNPKSDWAVQAKNKVAKLTAVSAEKNRYAMTRSAPATMRIATLVLSLLTVGCAGYHVGPVTQHNFKTIAVPMFQNRTLRPQLEAQITNATIKRLQEDGSLRIESAPDADVVLDGAVIHYERTTLRLLQNDTRIPREFEIAITVRVEAKDRRTGEVVLKPTEVTGKSDIFIGADQQSAEFQALPLIADDIARKVIGLLVENW